MFRLLGISGKNGGTGNGTAWHNRVAWTMAMNRFYARQLWKSTGSSKIVVKDCIVTVRAPKVFVGVQDYGITPDPSMNPHIFV